MISYNGRFKQSNRQHRQSVTNSLSHPSKYNHRIKRTQHGTKVQNTIFKIKNRRKISNRRNATFNKNINKAVNNSVQVNANSIRSNIVSKKLSYANMIRSRRNRNYISGYKKYSEISRNQSNLSLRNLTINHIQ